MAVIVRHEKNAGRALFDVCVKSNYEVVIRTIGFSVLYHLLKLVIKFWKC